MPYDEAYFQNQIRKSDDKVAWQYGKLLAFSGLVTGAPLRVLDAGCGAGPGLRYLAGRGQLAFGCDLVEYPLRAARELVPGARVAQCDLQQGLPFADGSFDVVLLSEVIEHVADARRVLRECRRVVEEGGAVVATTPNLWDARRAFWPLLGRVWAGDADPTHVELFDPGTLRRAFVEAGLARVHVSAGFKPLRWISSRRFRFRAALPWPPLVGNTLIARGYKDPVRREPGPPALN